MPGTIRIGVFAASTTQLLDISTIDLLGCMSHEYLHPMDFLPKPLIAIAPSLQFFFISSSVASGRDIPLTCDASLGNGRPHTDPEVAPGKLDIVIVPGPPPDSKFDPDALAWLKRQSETEGVDILSVCTGIYVCSAAGITKGKKVSGPRGLQQDLHKKFPDVKLVGDEYRWVRDGNFWSSGGITNGNDLMIAYARHSEHFPDPVIDFALTLTDIDDRGQKYSRSTLWENTIVLWSIARAWFIAPRTKQT